MRKIYFVGVTVLFVAIAIRAQTPASTEIEKRVESLLAQLSLEEKIDMLGGVNGFYVRGNPRIGLPSLKMADGPIGVRNYGPATAMAGGIALAATWNPELAQRVGTEIGRDARARGVHFLLGPGVNIYRAPMNGRNFEYFGEDPFLASRIAVEYIEGMQSQGVSATIKHFMGNNSEYDRHNTDSIIDERTMREIYLPVFEAAIKEAHVGAIMDAYNLTNGLHMTQNSALNTAIAKKEWGFDGIIMSDWFSTYDGVAVANGGLDLEMPSGKFMNRQTLLPAIQMGQVSVATIDDKVRRVLRKAVEFGWLDREQVDNSIPIENPSGQEAALQSARESAVLLKNDAKILPLRLDNMKTVLVVGPDADPAVPVGGGSAQVRPFAATSLLAGLRKLAGDSVRVQYIRGIPSLDEIAAATSFSRSPTGGEAGVQADYFVNRDLQGVPMISRKEGNVDFGAPSQSVLPEQTKSMRFTGYYNAQKDGSYSVFVEAAEDHYRLYLDDKLVFDDWNALREMTGYTTVSWEARPHKIVLECSGNSGNVRLGIAQSENFVSADAKAMAKKSDAVVIAVGFDADMEGEGGDRSFRLPPGQDELIQEMAAVNKNAIVVMTSGGGVDMHSWLDRVAALLEVWYPGQEGGTAIAEILFGKVNPSGKLPISMERRWEDNPVHNSYYPDEKNRILYKEGVFLGYRGYQHSAAKPLFPFGYGLSYTHFTYSNLTIGDTRPCTNESCKNLYQVAFDATNIGAREGAEVAQVYVGEIHPRVPRPVKELKGFEKVSLKPGQSKHITITLNGRAFCYYDVKTKQWRADAAAFDVFVGGSSAQNDLHGKITLTSSASISAGLK